MSGMLINKNAQDILKTLVKKRKWHEGKIETRKAGEYKKNILAGRLSYQKSIELLRLLGWEKIVEESWQKKETPT